MTYPQAISYLESFINYEKLATYPYKESLKLERVKGFLDIIGNPQEALRCIHIAGSKGKGSTAAYITYILRQAGFKVGLYTSPHLSDFRERIRILSPQPSALRLSSGLMVSGVATSTFSCQHKEFEGMISGNELANLVKRLKPAVEKYNKISKYGELSFFEVYTALAFIYFKEQKVDLAVLETGLGGRLDATNTCNPLVCAITPISYEHTQKLGNTLTEIAGEKSGIIKGHKAQCSAERSEASPKGSAEQSEASPKGTKHKSIVISAPQEEEALQVIRKRCQETGARLYEVKKPLTGVKLPLVGKHQKINAAVAVAAVKALKGYGYNISDASISQGLRQTLWPARCEVIGKNPLVVLDGAQNASSAKAIKEAVKDNFQFKKLILVLGVSKDKDIKGICKELRDLADEVILTKADNPRALEPEELVKYFRGRGKEIHLTASVKEAKLLAKKLTRKKDLILITGSLFVAGEAR